MAMFRQLWVVLGGNDQGQFANRLRVDDSGGRQFSAAWRVTVTRARAESAERASVHVASTSWAVHWLERPVKPLHAPRIKRSN